MKKLLNMSPRAKALYYTMLTGLLVMPVMVGAQLSDPKFTTTDAPLTDLPQLFQLFVTLTNWFLAFALIVGVVMIIVGGVMYITAAGSADKAKTASKLIAYAAIGIAIVALAWAIVRIVISISTGDNSGDPFSQ